MLEVIVQKIKSILDANDLLQASYSFENQSPNAAPFATITPSANESDYDTTTENRRVYAFLIRLYNERGGQIEPEDAESAMREHNDSVINDLDKDFNLSGIENPTGLTFLFMEAAPSSWGYIDEPAQYRIAEITVRCHVNVDINLIS